MLQRHEGLGAQPTRPAKPHIGTWVRQGVPRGCLTHPDTEKRHPPLVPIGTDQRLAGTTTSKDWYLPVQFHCLRMSLSSSPSFPHTCASGALNIPKLACRTAITKTNRFTQSRTQGSKTRMSGRSLCGDVVSLRYRSGLLPVHPFTSFSPRRELYTWRLYTPRFAAHSTGEDKRSFAHPRANNGDSMTRLRANRRLEEGFGSTCKPTTCNS